MGQLNPYLNFSDGKCREAMNFYKECLGGELTINKVSDMPEMAKQCPPEMADAVMHSMLVSGPIVIMGSDMNREKPVDGNTVHLCIACESENELNSFFNGLSKGGTVVQPIADMPWGAKYAEIKDKYNKHWLFNYQITPMNM